MLTLPDQRAMCFSKKVYPSLDHAEAVAKKVKAERGVRLRAYACPVCEMVHLTKKGVGRCS